jgi:protein TonB
LSVADSIETRPSASARLRAPLRQRSVAFALALIVELGLALLLWLMAPVLADKKPPPTTTTFGIDTVPGETEEPARTEQKKAAAKSAAREKAQPELPKPVETPPPPQPEQTPLPSTFIRMTRREFAAADIKGKGSVPAAPAAGEPAAASGSRPGDSAVVGKAPNGEPLYAAEWYRRPRDAELAPYRSRRALGPGWGQIICRTIANHRVEDCQEVGESPRGSGYAGGVRQAAWQFLVRAPRVGGKELVGTWVSIRITYSNAAEE